MIKNKKKMFKKDTPYNNLPLLLPKIELETKETLKAAIAANKAIAQLKGIAKTIPNETMLINTLPLHEARSSSEIEHIVTTNDKLYEAMASKITTYDFKTKEVLRYREALWKGFHLLKKRGLLTTNLFLEVYRTIKETDAGIRKLTGTRIQSQNGKIFYTPPEGENVIHNKLKNLETFIHSETRNIDPLIKSALIHYQFEAIHPFTGGNGRAGRILIVLYLIQQKYLDLPILYFSKYIIKNKAKYSRLIRAVTEKEEWIPWILFILKAIEETSIDTANTIGKINKLFDKTLAKAKQKLPTRVYSKELIELIFRQPYCKVEHVVQAGIAKRQTGATYLKELAELKILKSKKVGKEILYVNTGLYKILSKE